MNTDEPVHRDDGQDAFKFEAVNAVLARRPAEARSMARATCGEAAGSVGRATRGGDKVNGSRDGRRPPAVDDV